MKTVTQTPVGFDTNLHKLGIYFPYNIIAYRDGIQFDFSIKVRDALGRPDCKISDFGNNVCYRPKPALNTDWNGYSSYGELSRAVKLLLIKRGYDVVGWYEREY